MMEILIMIEILMMRMRMIKMTMLLLSLKVGLFGEIKSLAGMGGKKIDPLSGKWSVSFLGRDEAVCLWSSTTTHRTGPNLSRMGGGG
jgi:hypothetical protein